MEYEQYIKRMEEIRRLSTPALDNIKDADGYSRLLRDNFTRIGELAAINREFLDSLLYPLLKTDHMMDEDFSSLIEFTDELVCAESAENVDLPVVFMVSDSLISNAMEYKDLGEQIRQHDIQIGIIYELMNMTGRIRAYPEIMGGYRKKGFELGDYFFRLLQKEEFEKLDDPEVRQIVVIDARYSIAFFEGIVDDAELNEKQLTCLQQMYDIAKDPFYIERLEGFDWDYHMFRTLEYYLLAVENNNAAGFTQDQLEIIYQRGLEYRTLWNEKKDHLNQILGSEQDTASIETFVSRIEYLTGRVSKEEYRKRMLELYDKRDSTCYETGKMYANMVIPVELAHTIDPECITEYEKSMMLKIYQDVISFAFHMPNGSGLTSMLEYLYAIIDNFVEIPSRLTFEDMVLECMAAIHPPTYVHSQMVGQLTECLCGHLIRLMPERLIGVCDTTNAEDVKEKRGDILYFAYHAALCHDLGKISIIDTVFMYGRKLLDMEFDLIQTHPKTSYELMCRFSSTKKYAEVALGHHKWYDNSRGYPADFDTSTSKVKPITDLVLVADCLDAATDTIGRSYQRGKQLDDFIGELKEGSGSRYAPWVLDLFADDAVREDLTYLLREGRNQNYRNMYYMLREMHER
ncbi:MAG: hypothetical protein IKR58_06790 [Lachnospiraceae bacterium]|nr:hypothetical protein [Lachnospiraceae bacterium]